MITGPLFSRIRDTDKKFIILQGGGDAGKTSDTLKYIGLQASVDPDRYTVTAQDTPNIKLGALYVFQKYVYPHVEQYIERYNKSELTYYYKNGSIVEFKGFDDEQDARGSERGYLFMNEVNSRSYDLFWQLQRKTRKKVIVDYNPSALFWLHSKVMGLVDGEIPERQFAGKWVRWITNHTHNPFLSKEEHEAYESISDPDIYRVYTKGFTGKIKGLIFGHFKKIHLHELPTEFDRVVFGEDYGFTADPCAIVKMYVKGRQRYFQKLSYTPGLSAEQMIDIKKAAGWVPGIRVYGDTGRNMHDGGVSMINQQRLKGVAVEPAIKGLAVGIAKMREYECFYVSDPDFDTEIANYKWVTAKDMVTGKEVMTNIPVDAYNHILDACRYAGYTDSFRHR